MSDLWPAKFPDWFAEYRPAAELHIRGRLRHYPVLRPFEDRLIHGGLFNAEEIGRFLARHPAYRFDKGPHFGRWLKVVAYREALRQLFPLEPVEAALGRLPEDDKRVLRLRYIDQLCDLDTAHALDLRHPTKPAHDPAAAAARSRAAYDALCRALPKTADALRPNVAVASVFPAYPCGA